MIRYVLRRLVGAVPLVLGIATLVFVLLALAPGDPTNYFLRPGMRPEVLDRIRATYGLDDSLFVRYVKWLWAVLRGDFGYSISFGRPVWDILGAALPHTLLLSGVALVLTFLSGVAVGVVQAVRRGTWLDTTLSVVTLFFYSMPSFWLALMVVLVFSLYAGTEWGWVIHFPASGATSVNHDLLSPTGRILDRLRHLVLPAATLTLVMAAGIARFARSSMLEVVGQDYIRTARAKGLPERTVILKHALRNALLPIVSLLGLYLPLLLSGTVFVEYVFQWPGLGRAMVEAALRRDYPVVLASTILFSAVVVVANLIADVLYGVVDPRIRHG